VRVLALMAVLAFSGCAAVSSYQLTAERLAGEEWFDGLNGLRMQWRRLGNEGTRNIPDEELQQGQETLAVCVDELESAYSNAPSERVQVVQLLQCMEGRGWHLEVSEFFIVT